MRQAMPRAATRIAIRRERRWGTYPSSSGDASGFLMLFQAARRRTKKFPGERVAPSRAGVPARRGRVASLSREAGSPGE
jgi:hypothetical protein